MIDEECRISHERKALSCNEITCVYWLSRGKSFDETALIMNKSYSTIKTYVERIKVKFNVTKISQVIYYAVKDKVI